MAALRQRLELEFSELRTIVLGPQILLGFQYEALFQPRFESLPRVQHDLYLIGLALLNLIIVLMISPTSHHHLACRGDASPEQSRFSGLMLCASTGLFALAVALIARFAIGGHVAHANLISASLGLCALIAWIGMEIAMKRPTRRASTAAEPASLADKIKHTLTETRIALPGVQALLGFQLAAYLTDGFGRLPASAQTAHSIGLVLLFLSMIALMAPAPFHRIAEGGEDTERAERVGTALVLIGLLLLGAAIVCDLFVATLAVTHDEAAASWAAGIATAVTLTLWFIFPLLRRAPSPLPSATSRDHA